MPLDLGKSALYGGPVVSQLHQGFKYSITYFSYTCCGTQERHMNKDVTAIAPKTKTAIIKLPLSQSM